MWAARSNRRGGGRPCAEALAKAALALDLEHRVHVHAAMTLDLLVEIDEGQAIMRGKPSPDRGLAGTGGADEEQVVRRIHGQMLTGRIGLGRSTGGWW